MNGAAVVLGIDVGTQGARVVAHERSGALVGSESERFGVDTDSGEQRPDDWWAAVVTGLRRMGPQLAGREIAGVSVTSTSGTVLPLDRMWRPVAPASMYHDRRAAAVAEEMAASFPELGANVSWGLPKIVWFERAFPELAGQIHAWRHPADVLIGKLTGEWEATDQTTALKSGFDLVRERWPAEVFEAFGVDLARMPQVGRTGDLAGRIDTAAAKETGLPLGVPVLLGMTDGCASQISSGAVRPGAWNSTIGTTLVIKGTTVEPMHDPAGRIYNHRHPQGYWMPGAASNTGAAWISAWFPGRDLAELDRLAAAVIPTGTSTYPLIGMGERFPFVSAPARGFGYEGSDEVVRYASALEGVAYLERMAFDLVEALSGERVDAVSTAGGGSAGETWLRMRASVLARPVRKVRNANAASGAAMIAAGSVWFDGLIEAVEAMVELETVIEPGKLVGAYQAGYAQFREELARREYAI